MTCSNCGNSLKPDTRFCPACGTSVELTAIANLISDQDPRITAIEKALGNKYKILRKLGSGGFADVYLGEHSQLGRNVAIKILRVAEDEEMIERFRRESRAAAKLSHPNIIDIYDVGDTGNIYYFVMKYIPGDTLSQRMHREGKFPPATAIHIIKQLADALAYAHDRGIIHRDIKPANVLLDEFGKPVLMDFGIARLSFGGQLTRTGTLMGTPHYLPPEQPLGKTVDGRSDIYSLGIMFYEMLAGRVPFHDEAAIALIYKHINEAPRPLQEVLPDISPALAQIVHKMIEKDQNNRFQSAYEVYEELENVSAIYPFQGVSVGARGRGTPETVRNTEKLLLLAEQHAHEKKFVQAMEIYSTILQRHPDHPEGKKKLDAFLSSVAQDLSQVIARKEFDKAKGLIDRLEQLLKDDARVKGLRSSLDREEQKHRKETEFLGHFESAQLALKHDNAAGAVEHLTQALIVDPENEDAKTLLRQARAAYEKNRRKAELVNILAEAEYYYNNSSYEDALAVVQKAIKIEQTPEVTQLHEKIQSALRLQEQKEAERQQVSVEVERLCQQLNFDQARIMLENIRPQFPDLAIALTSRVDRAGKLYQKFLDAEAFVDQSKWDEAAKSYSEFLAPTSYDYPALHELRQQAESGLQLVQNKMMDAEIDQSLKKADVFLRMGQLAQAKEECLRILQKRSDHPAARAKLESIEEKLRPEQQDADTGELLRAMEEPLETKTHVVIAPPIPPPPAAQKPVFKSEPAPSIPAADRVQKPPQPPTVTPPKAEKAQPSPEGYVKPATPGVPPMMLVLGGIFLLLIVVGAIFLFWPSGPEETTDLPPQPQVQKPQQQKPPPPPPPATVSSLAVSIDVQPWASVEITGGNLQKTLAETTPAIVSLPAGKYSVVCKNPNFATFTKTIDVSERATKFQFQFEQLDAEKLAESLVK